MYRLTLDNVENGYVVHFASAIIPDYKRTKVALKLDDALGISDEFIAKHAMDVDKMRQRARAQQDGDVAKPLEPPPAATGAAPAATQPAPKAPPPPPAPKTGKASGAKAQ